MKSKLKPRNVALFQREKSPGSNPSDITFSNFRDVSNKGSMSLFLFTVNLFKFQSFYIRSSRCFSADTIFSLSSGYGKCGVSVIRVSGSRALDTIHQLIAPDLNPKPRFAALRTLQHPKTKDIIDRGLILWFPGPKSFTGENSCEFQVHGSVAVVAAMLDALSHVPGCRLARPGEFTKRAFLNGKLDLTEVEGLADLIHAETEAQRKQALLQSTGSLSRIYKCWREKLIKNAAYLEAYIDFAEDENIEDDIIDHLKTELKSLLNDIEKHLNDHRQGEMLRHGVKTVIIGAPNVGKSSLLNTICQKNISIVTSIAGTTRDIIESTLNIGGYPVVFADTAGLRQKTDDIVESEGISKAVQYLEHADMILLVTDAKDLVSFIEKEGSDLRLFIEKYLQDDLGIDAKSIAGKCVVPIANKIDVLNIDEVNLLKNIKEVSVISCKENTNIEAVLDILTTKLKDICGQPCAENPRLTQSRYRHHLKDCTRHLEEFLDHYDPEMCPDMAIAAQKLRTAVRCIEQITGHVSTEDILDVIFRDFCIGK